MIPGATVILLDAGRERDGGGGLPTGDAGRKKYSVALDKRGKCGIILRAAQDARPGATFPPLTRGCTARLRRRAGKSPHRSASPFVPAGEKEAHGVSSCGVSRGTPMGYRSRDDSWSLFRKWRLPGVGAPGRPLVWKRLTLRTLGNSEPEWVKSPKRGSQRCALWETLSRMASNRQTAARNTAKPGRH